MSFADPLDAFGFGGGDGHDSVPFGATTVPFRWNFMRAAQDIAGANGGRAVIRQNVTATYTQSTDVWGAWSFTSVDRSVGIASTLGCDLLLTINPQSPTTASKIPKITTGVMASWKTKVRQIPDRYNTTAAGAIKAGSVINMGDGTNITLPATYTSVVTRYEVWNEPNQIGGAGGALLQATSTRPGGSNQGRPWYDLVYMINRDALLGLKASAGWGTFDVAAITMGGLEPDYLRGNSFNTWGVLSWAVNQGGFPSGFRSVAMHCYQSNDPLTAVGGETRRGVLDTIKTSIRPAMDANGFAAQYIWITETGIGGSHSPGGGGTEGGKEYWNHDKATARGVTVAGASNHALTATFWGHKFGDAGANTSQTAGMLSQPFIITRYVQKARELNTTIDAKIELIVWHMLIRPYPLDVTAGAFFGTTATNYLVQADENSYWHLARAIIELLTANSDKNANATSVSTGYLEGAVHLKAEIAGAAGTAPSNTVAPSINNLLPKVSDVLSVDKGTWSGSPTPTYGFKWKRDGVEVASGKTYTVVAADVGHVLTATVTATNASGSVSVTTAATGTVRDATAAPVNTDPPTLQDAQGLLSDANAPTQGQTVTLNAGLWTPLPSRYKWAWEKRNPTTGTITTL